MKLLYRIMTILTGIYTVICYYLGAFLIHVFTCYTVYESYGFFLGIIAFFSPIIAEIIMFILYLIFYGLFNPYCIIIIGYVIMVAFSFLLSYITSWLENKVKYKKVNITKENTVIPVSYTINEDKNVILSNIVMQGMGVNNVDEALEKSYEFYKGQEIDMSSINLKDDNKCMTLSKIVMLGVGANTIEEAIERTSQYYQAQGIEIK